MKNFIALIAAFALTACTSVATEVSSEPEVTHTSNAVPVNRIELIIYDSGTANAKDGEWIEFRFPKIFASNNDAVTASILDDLNRSVLDRVAKAEQQAKEIGEPVTGWEYEFEIKVDDIYSDEHLLIVNFAGYEYLGNAHGSSFKWTRAYDVKTGAPVQLREQILEGEFSEVLELVAQELEWYYEEGLFHTGEKLRSDLAKIKDVEAWRINSMGIEIVLPAYAVTAGYVGEPEVTIGWSNLKGLLTADSLLRLAYPVQLNSNCKEAFPGIDLETCK